MLSTVLVNRDLETLRREAVTVLVLFCVLEVNDKDCCNDIESEVSLKDALCCVK